MALRLQEHASYGKLNNEDIALLTGMKEFVPYDFAAFSHMLRNIKFLCQFIDGKSCLAAMTWGIALEHATLNECLYREEFLKNKHFYVSILDDYHRRFQTFVQSCAFGSVDKLRTSQLQFDKICESVELFEYVVRTPSWLLKRTRPASNPQSAPSTTACDISHKRQRTTNQRSTTSEKVINTHLDEQMRPPRSIKFGTIFNPTNRDGIKPTPHPDGSNKCNNFHHRGFCWSNCRYKHSHEKILTESEINSGRKYLNDLIGKLNATNNTSNPKIPSGLPPKTPVDNSKPNPTTTGESGKPT